MKKKERKEKGTGREASTYGRGFAPRKGAAWAPDGLSMSGSRGWSWVVLKVTRSCGLSGPCQESSPRVGEGVVTMWRQHGLVSC
jgi:hypothetical protein